MASKEIKAIDFFCSGGGMSYGLSQGGINVLGGIDINSECEATYTANIKDAIYVCKDVF